MRNQKKNLRDALETDDLNSVISWARTDRKVLSQLVRIAYDKESLNGWRAIKVIGLAAREIVKSDYEFLRELVRKQLWSLTDESGGIGWSAPEILGEIVSSDTERFHDIIPLIAEIYSIEEKVFRPGVLYAMDRIAMQDPILVLPYKQIIFQGLKENDPLARVFAIVLLQKVIKSLTPKDSAVAKEFLDKMVRNRDEVWIYKDDGFANVQVGEEALKALRVMSAS